MTGPSARVDGDALRVLGVGDLSSIHLIRWAGHLVSAGHEVHVATPQPGREHEVPAGVQGHVLRDLDPLMRIPLVRRARIVPALRNLARELRPNVVHGHYLLPFGALAARMGARPLVVSPWGTDALVAARPGQPGRAAAQEAIRAADALVVNSGALEEACRDLGADPERLHRIYWHVDLAPFGPERAEENLRTRLGFPPDALVILSLRNFRPDTNLDVLVRAFARVVREEPRARLVLAARSGPLREDIERIVAELGLDQKVAFDHATPGTLPSLVAAADVCVSLASSDSAPPSLLEAMASGRALVYADAASIGEWVAQDAGAEIVPQRNEEATAAALLRLLGDETLRAAYGSRNRRVVSERVEPAGRALERLYRDVAA
ncbi:MAG: glycosyltransferase family 4 protein [Gaiellaceae bacterium]